MWVLQSHVCQIGGYTNWINQWINEWIAMLLNEYVASLLTPLGGSFYIKAPLTFGLLIPALPIIAIQTMIQLWISFTLFLLGVKRVMQSAQYEWQDGAKVINVRKWEKKKSTKPRIHQHNSLYLFVLANRHCVYHFHTLSLNCLMFFKLLSSFFFLRISLIPYNPLFLGCSIWFIHSWNTATVYVLVFTLPPFMSKPSQCIFL